MTNKKLTVSDLVTLTAGKEIFIWGSMIVGQGVCRSLERNNLAIRAFVDSSTLLQKSTALGYKVLPPQQAIESAKNNQALIIISSGHYDNEIADTCKDNSLQAGRDYILSRQLNDIDPSVDISGLCNLHCISCPWGNMPGLEKGGFISSENYKKVLDKLLREIPLLGSIQLYTWGEPLLNPELPQIISLTREAKVLAALSTNLNIKKDFSEVIKARPDWFKVSTSGFGEDYEITHSGGDWPTLSANLAKLHELRREYHPQMQVVVNYHLYRHNTGEAYDKMQKLCEDYNFIFRPNHAYLYSLDNVMDYTKGKELSAQAKQTLDLLLLDIDEGLRRARMEKGLPCAEERCLPITYDMKVKLCGVYIKGFSSQNFLEEPLDTILQRKKSCDLCKECKSLGLHRYTGIYLAEKVFREGTHE